MAALPVSPHGLYNVSRFAQEIWQSCRTSKAQFEGIGSEVFALKTAVELVALELEDKTLPVNQLDEDGKTRTHYRQLGIHIGNCQQALQAVHDCVRRHEKQATWQQLRWGWSGKEDVDGLVANVVSFATQLDSFVGALNLKAMGKMLGRIGRVEQLLDQTDRNEAAAVTIIMADLASTGMPHQNLERYRAILTSYAQEASKVIIAPQGTGKKTKVDPAQERNLSDAALAATSARLQQRSHSADTVSTTASTTIERSHSANPSGNKQTHRPNKTKKPYPSDPLPFLECWLIQIKTGNFTFLAWQKSGKEPQPRGQPQLHAMARHFRAWQASSSRSGTADEYDLVGWVIDDRQKSEPDPTTYIWRPHAFKLERRTPPLQQLLDTGVEEQALVIISRSLTPSGLAAQDQAQKLAQAHNAALKQQAKASERHAREQAKRRAEIRHLQQQVATLGLNQQPTLADKPEAIAEKKRAEKRAREEAERRKIREMEERRANVGKVKLALWGVEIGSAGPRWKGSKEKGNTAYSPLSLSPPPLSPSSHSLFPTPPRSPLQSAGMAPGKGIGVFSGSRLCRVEGAAGGGMQVSSSSSDSSNSKMFVTGPSRLETVVE